jgi:hypothetical protein
MDCGHKDVEIGVNSVGSGRTQVRSAPSRTGFLSLAHLPPAFSWTFADMRSHSRILAGFVRASDEILGAHAGTHTT